MVVLQYGYCFLFFDAAVLLSGFCFFFWCLLAPSTFRAFLLGCSVVKFKYYLLGADRRRNKNLCHGTHVKSKSSRCLIWRVGHSYHLSFTQNGEWCRVPTAGPLLSNCSKSLIDSSNKTTTFQTLRKKNHIFFF